MKLKLALLPVLAVLMTLSLAPAEAQLGWSERAISGPFGSYYSGYYQSQPGYWSSFWDTAGTRIGLGFTPPPGRMYARSYARPSKRGLPDFYFAPSLNPYASPALYGYPGYYWY